MKKIAIGLILVLLLATAAPAGLLDMFRKNKVDAKTMNKLGSSLTKLSAAVESTVRYKNPPRGISDQELLKLATQHDPGLLDAFKNYKLRVLQQNRHAVVLVCDKKGKQGLLEDAGCTGRMENQLWQDKKCPCKFTIKPEDICKK